MAADLPRQLRVADVHVGHDGRSVYVKGSLALKFGAQTRNGVDTLKVLLRDEGAAAGTGDIAVLLQGEYAKQLAFVEKGVCVCVCVCVCV